MNEPPAGENAPEHESEWARSEFTQRERSLGNLTQQIVQDLGTAIVTGHFSESGFPIEADICKHYDASRSIVREALKVLNAKGLLMARPRRGTRVRPEREWNLLDPDVLGWMLSRRFNLSLLIDFTRARLAIEPAASAEAARTATDAQKKSLGLALDGLRVAVDGDDASLEADIRFHRTILEASNNRFFYQMSPMIETALRFSIRYTNQKLHTGAGCFATHESIATAILEGDEAAAAEHSRTLLKKALDIMVGA